MQHTVIEFLQELIRTKSFSGQEGKIARIIRKKIEDLAYEEVYTDELGNIIGRIGNGTPKIMLEGHMDTVTAGKKENWEMHPFSGVIREEKVFGRGAADMKGSIASMVYAGCQAKEVIEEFDGSLYLVFVVHEETVEGAAIKNVIENHVQPDYVILGEPSDFDVCVGHRGRAVVDLKTSGRSAHASMPQLGENAALKLIEAVNQIRGIDLSEDPCLGKETKALVHISCEPDSGPVIPNKARAIFDFRIIEETSESILRKKIRDLLENAGLEGKVEIIKKTHSCYTGNNLSVKYYFPAWKTEATEFIHAVREGLGFIENTPTRYWSFSTDGVYTAGTAGLPTVGFGPGKEKLAHQPNEYVEIRAVELALKAYKNVIEQLLRKYPFCQE